MADPQNFLDNLKNLGVVMSVALEYTQKNLGEFTQNGTEHQLTQAERSVATIRTLAAQLEKEFNSLDYLTAEARRSSGSQ